MIVPKNKILIDSLNELFDQNLNFIENSDKNRFIEFANKQTPQFTLLKCCDSRMQIDSFCQKSENHIFTVSNIGNQIKNNLGSIDFGIRILKTPILLIIGHSMCGAVESALSCDKSGIDTIDEEIKLLHFKSNSIKQAIIENINNQVSFSVTKYQSMITNSQLNIIGALYDFNNDYGFGFGKLILISINGISDRIKIKNTYSDIIANLNIL